MRPLRVTARAHYWTRKLQALGHTVKLMAPQFVKPYVKTNKHDAADAGAICEAGTFGELIHRLAKPMLPRTCFLALICRCNKR